MTTPLKGPRQVCFQRLFRACRKEGVKKVEYHSGDVTIVIPLDDSYLETMAQGHPPVPDTKPPEEEDFKLNW